MSSRRKETERVNGPLFPGIKVSLSDADGNAFSIIGKVSEALRRNGVNATTIEEFHAEAMSGDYNNVIATAMRWVNVT